MNDDLDEEIINVDDGLDSAPSKNTLGDLWRTNPLVKIGVVVVAMITIASAAVMLGGESTKQVRSDVGQNSDIASTPGATEGATPAYVAAIAAENEEKLEEALQKGTSTMPVPVEGKADRLVEPEEAEADATSEDPLMRWRRLQEERLKREVETQVEIEPVEVLDAEQQSEAVKRLAEAMSAQMQTILGKDDEDKTKFTYMSLIEYEDLDGDKIPDIHDNDVQGRDGTRSGNNGNQGGGNGFDDLDAASEDVDVRENIIIPAGEIEYAQTILEANSDVPGPVLAVLMSGPLSGSKMLGSFTVVDDYLTINFETVIVDGESYDITAVAIDPGTSLPGMATEVDHRYFKRVVLPAAAAFVEGFAEAVGQMEQTSITIDTGTDTTTATSEEPDTEEEVANGIKEAGQEVREILDDMADDTKVLVKIHAGTPIGVLFTEPVVEEDT